MGRRLKRLLPWVVALGLLGYLLQKINLADMLAALTQCDLPLLFGAVILGTVGAWVGDGWATSRVLSWFLVPVGFRELLAVRAASYLLAIVNANLGQAGLIYYVHRTRRVPVLAVTGLTLMFMGTVLLVLSGLSLGGVLLAPDDDTRRFSGLLAILGLGAAIYFVLLRIRPRALARIPLLTPLFRAGVTGHLKATLVRLPHVLFMILGYYLVMRAFYLTVPLHAGMTFIPLVFLVSWVPVTPFGLGTMQMATVHFFARYAGDETLAARQARALMASLAGSALPIAFQALLGLVFLHQVGEMMRPEDDSAH